MTPAIASAIKAKRAAFRLFKKHPSSTSREDFKQKRNLVTHLLRKSERAHATTLHRSLRLSPSPASSRDFWQHMKAVQGKVKHTIIPDLAVPASSSVAHTPADKANTLHAFFCQQTILPGADSVQPDSSSLPTNSESFTCLQTTPREVYDILSCLKEGKAPGLDGLSPRLLRYCACGISSSLSVLFNRSFSEGSFPSAWKTALVIPVFKKGSRSDPGNYRPIALLSIVSKVMERLVHNKLSRFLQPWLCSNQSGFKKKDGTEAQLTRLLHEWSVAVDDSNYVAAVFFDLRKAFDRVWHQGLLAKLAASGVKGLALKWLTSFLSGRRQATLVDGTLSDFSPLHAGVPQGAILSPLLFSVYMNDIPSPQRTTNLFADDTSSYVISKDAADLPSLLQSRIDVISTWFRLWQLSVNTAKSAVMVFRSQRMRQMQVQVSIDSAVIPQVATHRHLGLVFSETLTWSRHVDYVTSKASSRIGFLRRLRKRCPSLVLQTLYQCCIRPVLEYASVTWSGMGKSDARRLERCNRSAARLITGTSLSADLPHPILLARAGLDSLEARRNLAQCKFCYRLLHDSQPGHLQDAFHEWLPPASTHHMRRRSLLVRLPRPKKSVLQRSPIYHSFVTWNSLPSTILDSPTPSAIVSHFT